MRLQVIKHVEEDVCKVVTVLEGALEAEEERGEPRSEREGVVELA
jgi:hypothetical protein